MARIWMIVAALALPAAEAWAQDAPASPAPPPDAAAADPAAEATAPPEEVPPAPEAAAIVAPAEGEPAPMEGEAPVEGEPVVEEEVPSPWSAGLITSMAALAIGGGSAVLGIWVDRDKSRPVTFAVAMSFLITAAVSVGLFQSYLDADDAIQQRADLERMMGMVEEIAESSGDPKLTALLEQEGRKPKRGHEPASATP